MSLLWRINIWRASEEGSLTEAEEISQQILCRTSDSEADWHTWIWGTHNLCKLCFILWAISIIVSDIEVLLSSFVYMCKQTKDLKNKENATNNSSYSEGNSKDFSTELSISGKRPTFLIETSQRLYLCWHSSPTSLISLPI